MQKYWGTEKGNFGKKRSIIKIKVLKNMLWGHTQTSCYLQLLVKKSSYS